MVILKQGFENLLYFKVHLLFIQLASNLLHVILYVLLIVRATKRFFQSLSAVGILSLKFVQYFFFSLFLSFLYLIVRIARCPVKAFNN